MILSLGYLEYNIIILDNYSKVWPFILQLRAVLTI